MAWNNNYFKDDKESEGLVYDLRQTYAQILDEVLKRVAECRVRAQFIDWFNSLEDLQVEINQKFLPKERLEYQAELEKCIKILTVNKAVFNGASKDNAGIYEVKKALRGLEMWLKIKMEEHKLFGAKDVEDDGL